MLVVCELLLLLVVIHLRLLFLIHVHVLLVLLAGHFLDDAQMVLFLHVEIGLFTTFDILIDSFDLETVSMNLTLIVFEL